MWAKSSLLSEQQIAVLNQTGNWEKQWVFCRCQVNGMVYQCEGYKRVMARNNFTVAFVRDNTLVYGSIRHMLRLLKAAGMFNAQKETVIVNMMSITLQLLRFWKNIRNNFACK